LAPGTRAILQLAGVGPGMHVLDLGAGAGDVAFELADIVGPSGSVVGIDQSTEALARAERRRQVRGSTNCSFVEGDILSVELDRTFDAVVGRLVLLYAPDPAEIIRRHAARIRPGGVVVAMEFDMGVAGSIPPVRGVEQTASWIREAFRRAGLDPCLGARLGPLLAAAGLGSATVLGQQTYLQCDDRTGAQMLAGVVRTLLPTIIATSVATAEVVDIDTLEERVAAELSEHEAILRPPTLVGAWTTVNR
jgi:SAM-dependent methyltransferase